MCNGESEKQEKTIVLDPEKRGGVRIEVDRRVDDEEDEENEEGDA